MIIDALELSSTPQLCDPDDVHILACAISANTDAIVTGDNDLLTLEYFRSIPILTVRQALERLGVAGK